MRRLITALLGLAACAAFLVLAGASGGDPEHPRYKVVFDNAFGLVDGGDFRVGGVRAGQTTAFKVSTSRTGPPKAVVTVEVMEPGIPDFRADARCKIKPQSLVGEYYVDCQPGSAPEKLPADGSGTVPLRSAKYGDQTQSTIPPDLVQNMLRRPHRERLRLLVAGLGTGLAGRAEDFGEVLRRAHPGLRETARVLRILGEDNRVIERFLRDADTVVGELASHRREVARFLSQAGDTAETVATRRAELREATRRLPAFLGELRPSMRRLGELADRSVPLLADLQRAAPDLRLVLDRLGPFSSAALPALRKLGGAAKVGTGALRDGRRAVDELRRLAGDAPGTAKPLRQFLQTMDDRRRATDRDPRATVDGPPASDPSYGGGRGGFTGFESLANYFFWQALSVNAFDDLGHMLTVTANTGQCAEFANDPSEREVLEACNSWLGPRQPGINAPDPSTVGGAAASRGRAAVAGKRRGGGTRDAPGEAPAGTPGRAPSRPRVGLPAPLEELLVGELPATPGEGGQLLLDYLLGP